MKILPAERTGNGEPAWEEVEMERVNGPRHWFCRLLHADRRWAPPRQPNRLQSERIHHLHYYARIYSRSERFPETRDENHKFSSTENNLNIQISSTTSFHAIYLLKAWNFLKSGTKAINSQVQEKIILCIYLKRKSSYETYPTVLKQWFMNKRPAKCFILTADKFAASSSEISTVFTISTLCDSYPDVTTMNTRVWKYQLFVSLLSTHYQRQSLNSAE
jgi:hypothetical protein